MTTTTKEIRDRIETLRTESAAAGDDEMVATCDLALSGDDEALAECARVLADAEAMLDD